MAGISRPILVVIDALDECGDAEDGAQRAALLKLLSTPGKLPSNLRFFITSRPEPDIRSHFEDLNKDHIMIKHMSEIPTDSTSADISLYIRTRLISDFQSKLEGIDEACCQTLARTSQGLFQWAYVACKQIAYPPPGRTPLEHYKKLVQSGTGVGQDKLLDYLYLEAISASFSENDEEGMLVERFKSVLAVVLASFEPLTMAGVKAIHKTLKQPDEYYTAGDILQHLGSLLSGVNDTDVPIRPLHTSFRDFLTDRTRSDSLCVDIAGAHRSLTLASLYIMTKELRFKLESSYVMNEDILDLPMLIQNCVPEHLSYSCRFWACHLDIALPNGQPLEPEISHQIRELLEMFVHRKILFWLEVLSVLDAVDLAFPALAIVARVFKIVSSVFLFLFCES
ncbi:hypothetical protein EW026_g2047 [Hermanssonia centrifuga]|nr:hypothetical protein EW026_g2047 [Hermanssonia centrifuga]